MPKRIVKDTVVLYRGGKQVVPEVGKEFDFTAEEVTSITKSNPKALGKIGGDTAAIAAPIADNPAADKAKVK